MDPIADLDELSTGNDGVDVSQEPPAELFPPPPAFFKFFTNENIARSNALRESRSGAGEDASQAVDDPMAGVEKPDTGLTEQTVMMGLDGVGSGLVDKFIVPPELPADGKYRCFGGSFDLFEKLLPLSELGIDQLYTSPPKPDDRGIIEEWSVVQLNNMRSLNRSIMVRFVELIDTLATAPTEYPDRIASLTKLFLNYHHIINEYRSHQARESLISMLKARIERCEKEVVEVENTRLAVAQVFTAISNSSFRARPKTQNQPGSQAVQPTSNVGTAMATPATAGVPYSSFMLSQGLTTPNLQSSTFSGLARAGLDSLPASSTGPQSAKRKANNSGGPTKPKLDSWATLEDALREDGD